MRVCLPRAVVLGVGSLAASVRGDAAGQTAAGDGGSATPAPDLQGLQIILLYMPILNTCPVYPTKSNIAICSPPSTAQSLIHFETLPDKSAETDAGFLYQLPAKASFIIRTVFTDNGKMSTDRFCATGKCALTGPVRLSIKPAPSIAPNNACKPQHLPKESWVCRSHHQQPFACIINT